MTWDLVGYLDIVALVFEGVVPMGGRSGRCSMVGWMLRVACHRLALSVFILIRPNYKQSMLPEIFKFLSWNFCSVLA
ncbi:hypothetical protein ACH3XW_46405 [Acanthocheilonema viteae]